MAEYTANAEQIVSANSNILFTDVAVKGNNAIYHRSGSGLITLRGITCGQSRARFRATFNGNVGIPAEGTSEAISCAMSLDGEPETIMIVTPAETEEYFNISSTICIDVPSGCCTHLSIQNLNSQAIVMQNANLIVERIA